jgi:hypothetical protein
MTKGLLGAAIGIGTMAIGLSIIDKTLRKSKSLNKHRHRLRL